MAEPLTPPEIEDVLASIRRMVSEDPGRPNSARPLGRLILTPALRVDDPAEPAQPMDAQSVATAAPPPFRISQGEVYDRPAPIDDAVLQSMVRDLLTEELQGPLGEKVTRNIRKMVRAEISRALAAREIS